MQEEKSTLATSFLDVLSCGLGAAILLFLVFSVLPHQGLTPTGGPRDSVAGSATSLTEIGLRMRENLKVKSADVAIAIMFPVGGDPNVNLGITLDELRTMISFEGVVPMIPASVRAASMGEFVPEDASAEFSTVSDENNGQPTFFLVRRSIPGGQKKGEVILVKIKRATAFSGTLQVSGNINKPPLDFTGSPNKETRIKIDFSSQTPISEGGN